MLNVASIMFGAITVIVTLNSPLWAQDSSFPRNYMMEKHRIFDPFYCDLSDPIEAISCMSWDAALGTLRLYANENSPEFDRDLFHVLSALEAMSIVRKELNPSRDLLYLREGFGGVSHQLCLKQKRGLCGNHQLIFQQAMKFLGIESRDVSVYMELNNTRLSHAMNEIRLSNGWALIDTTNASIYLSNDQQGELLSYADTRMLDEKSRIGSRTSGLIDMSILFNKGSLIDDTKASLIREEQYAYLLDKTRVIGVIYDGEGHMQIDVSTDNVSEKVLTGLPNYIGTNNTVNNGIQATLFSKHSPQDVDVELNATVSGVGGCLAYGAILVDATGREFPLNQGSNQLTIKNGSSFTVKREPNEICYIAFADIALKR